MKKFILCTGLSILCSFIFAQKDKGSLELKSYVDAYYAYFDDTSIGHNQLQSFTTVSARDRQFSLNIAQFGLHYEAKNIRSNMTLHMGDIAQATWSSRFPFVQEANVGVHLFPNWWLDIGLFTTHIGTESFLPKNNYLSSTAVQTYNEPFYQAGAKLAYEGSDKFDLELWVTNGYNLFVDVNKDKSYGLLFTYNFNKNSALTYTNLTGNEQGNNVQEKALRSYHNLYYNHDFNNKVLISVGGDYGFQQYEGSDFTSYMYAALATVRLVWTDNFSTTIRQEIFRDPDGFISGYVNSENFELEGLQMTGTTVGAEYKPSDGSYWRIETRRINNLSPTAILFGPENPDVRWEIMTTVGYSFGKKW